MLDHYIGLLKEGELVAFPTETVYGLGADAWNPGAIQKVFEQKGRPSDNPLIIHISSTAMVDPFAREVSDDARHLMDHFWPGPLTLIFKKKPEVLDLITAGLDTVALRWPSHPLSQDLIANAGPLVAPSANSSGRPSPTRPEHIRDDFGSEFPIIDAGETNIGLESTVLDVSEKPYRIYRPGKITAEQISRVVSAEIVIGDQKKDTTAKSPGTKYSHYAPDASVRWLEGNESYENPNILYLLHRAGIKTEQKNIVRYNEDMQRLAHELYDRFRQADQDGYNTIAIEPFKQSQVDSLIPALENRINKAISK